MTTTTTDMVTDRVPLAERCWHAATPGSRNDCGQRADTNNSIGLCSIHYQLLRWQQS
jgi:hypothetical protein